MFVGLLGGGQRLFARGVVSVNVLVLELRMSEGNFASAALTFLTKKFGIALETR